MVDVTHNGNHRGTRLFDVVGIGGDQFFELLFDDHLLERHELNVKPEAHSDLNAGVLADGLVDRRKNTAFDPELDDVAGRYTKGFSVLADSSAFDQSDLTNTTEPAGIVP